MSALGKKINSNSFATKCFSDTAFSSSNALPSLARAFLVCWSAQRERCLAIQAAAEVDEIEWKHIYMFVLSVGCCLERVCQDVSVREFTKLNTQGPEMEYPPEVDWSYAPMQCASVHVQCLQ